MTKRRPKSRPLDRDGMEHLRFRGQHPPLEGSPALGRFDQSIVDSRGRAGNPVRVYDTLAALHRNGTIDDAMLQAGRDFEELYARCELDQLRAPDLGRVPGLGRGEVSDRVVESQERMWKVLCALGGPTTPTGSCARAVLGEGLTLKEFSERTHFSKGATLNVSAAKGVLVGALGVLAAYFGHARRP